MRHLVPIDRRSLRLACGGLVLLALACVSPMSSEQLQHELRDVGAKVPELGPRPRIVAIHADTKMEAWTLLADAQSDPRSELSRQLAHQFSLGATRKLGFVVGGPYPELSNRVLLNAIVTNRKPELPGLTVVLVSPQPPDAELLSAAARARVKLLHHPLGGAVR